jgi:asparagine synthase (glutamine-hydrolysing)
MCGICGQFHFEAARPVDPALLNAMTDTMTHRGPDDRGTYFGESVGLGFRRLSIIDLSGGRQPMSDRDERVWVAFNGEIYNFKQLRAELESHGHRFRTNSDTEVIVHGYKQWGVDVLERLNGMFGVAVWDVEKRRLMLARDRAGIKLVYYNVSGGTLTFGSEIRPVLAGMDARPELNAEALYLFLQYRYTPAPLTAWQGVRKLAPGARLIIEGGKAREERWWKPAPVEPLDGITPEKAVERLGEMFETAVERQLVSDVPLGLLLSGGLDSALLLAMMRRHGNESRTFSVGFGESFADDELADASRTAQLLGAPNAAVRIDRKTFEEALPKIVGILEEPIASPSIVPMYFVCERARRDVKVALMGQGPDELFGGYKRHLGVRYSHCWRALPKWLRAAAGGLGGLARNETLRRGLDSLDEQDRLQRYLKVFSLAPNETMRGLFRDGTVGPRPGEAMLDCWNGLCGTAGRHDELTGFQFLEIRSSLPDELLMYADKLSMHHSLEVRVPYLDHEIIEFAERLPGSLKIRNATRKWLYKRVCAKHLPPEIMGRKKRGFAANVVDDWFRQALDGRLNETLRDEQSLMYRFMEPRAVGRLLDEHKSGRNDRHKILFSLVMLEAWLRNGAAATVE